MGLASFNRMRRQRKPVALMEAERFVRHNAQRNASRKSRIEVHSENRAKTPEIWAEEQAASQRIGELVRAGLDSNDEPMRREHAAEIAGRNIEGVQTPKDPVARVSERIPEGTANEELVSQMLVSGPGPDPATLSAAREEAGVPDPMARRRERGPRAERAETEAAPDATQTPKRSQRRAERERTETERKSVLADRSSVEIPSNWRDLPWPRRRSVAARVSEEKINTQDEANAAIEAELRRRG